MLILIGNIDKNDIAREILNLKKREFLARNIHENGPKITQIYSISDPNAPLFPYLLASAKVQFYGKDYDTTKDFIFALNLSDNDEIIWENASINPKLNFTQNMPSNPTFAQLPAWILDAKDLVLQSKNFKDFLARSASLTRYDERLDSFTLKIKDKYDEILQDETRKFEIKFKTQREKLETAISRAISGAKSDTKALSDKKERDFAK